MSNPVTRSSIITRALQLVNFDTSASPSDQFVTNPLECAWADSSARELYDKLVIARGQEYYSTEATFPTVPGQSVYDLDARFYQLLTVYINGPTFIGFSALTPFAERDIASLLTYGLVGIYTPLITQYRLRGRQANPAIPGDVPLPQIELLPVPKTAYAVFYRFIPVCQVQADPTKDFVYDGIDGFEEWSVCDLAARFAIREERDPAPYLTLRSYQDKRIADLAGARDAGMPERTVDVRQQARYQALRRAGGARMRWWT